MDPIAARPRRNFVTRRAAIIAALAVAYLCGTAIDAFAQRCQPRRKLPPIMLTTLGPCEFNPRDIQLRRRARPAGDVPDALGNRAAQSRPDAGDSAAGARDPRRPTRRPAGTRDARALLVELGLVWDYAPFLWQPLSRARDNDPDAPQARYFVIHDTSGPNFGGRPFPENIDEHRSINNLARFRCGDGWEIAHVIINRIGAMLLGHELGQPWRAMRFERATRFGTDLKGLFLHVELVQPRRSQPGRGRRNDGQAPTPGFSDIQYDRLALIYTIASVRSGRWLIPAFHIAIDSGIRGGHDDPQNFEIAAFAGSIERLVNRLAQLRQAGPDARRIVAQGDEAE